MLDFEIWEAIYTDTEDPARQVIKRMILCVEKFWDAAANAYTFAEQWNETHELPSNGYLTLQSLTFVGTGGVDAAAHETVEHKLFKAVFPDPNKWAVKPE